VKDATDVESEVSLHAASATVGGKFDLLMKKNGTWTLVDWKTNGEDLEDVPTGKVGLDDLTKNLNNNPYNKYALQLNVYEWAAKDSGKIPKDAKVSKELHQFQYIEDGQPVKISVVKVPDL
jgi:ATP-dependent exoDNAse (exonuclease V) beta subunit